MARPVYLVDFAVYKPPEELKVDLEKVQEAGKHWPMYSEDVKDFMLKVFEKSGLSPCGTYLPAAVNPQRVREPKNDIDTAMLEARMVMTGAVSEVLEKTGLKPSDIDILITSCSIFCPTPSLASMLVNHFKFREDIQAYHLGGMGCGTGVIGIGLVKELLKARPNLNALFVPAEITTYAFYPGKKRSFLVSNVIFRMGGAAVLLSNKPRLAWRAKYLLQCNVRAHKGQRDESYGCMAWRPDPDGINGVYLSKDIVTEASFALEYCLRKTAPQVMTWGQYACAAGTILGRAMGKDWPEYRPDFTKGVDHFAIHAGGYAVLKGVQEGMGLPNDKMLASFAALRDYGNTSCGTTWYVLAYLETCDSVKPGQVVMQVGMGGGMKAGVNVWRALRRNKCVHRAWEHLKDAPLTEQDLPRAIAAIRPRESLPSDQRQPSAAVAADPPCAKAAAPLANGVPAPVAAAAAAAAEKLGGLHGVPSPSALAPAGPAAEEDGMTEAL